MFVASLPLFGGLSIWDANPKIVDVIREHGRLLHVEKITHSYMHCWRHKTPIIYRATIAVVRRHGRRTEQTAEPAARAGAARHRSHDSFIRNGARRGCTA